MKINLFTISRNVSFINILSRFDFSARLFNRFLTTIICCAVLVLSSTAQTIRKVEILSPAIGNASNNEVAVVNSTGLVYTAGQAFGNNFGVIDPNTNQLIKVIRPADLNSSTVISFSRVNQTTNIVYFLYATTPNAQIVSIDGRPSSSTFNQLLPPMVFNNQTLAAFAIDQTRNLLYASTRTTGSNPVQSQVHTVDINPGSATFHQILSTVALPAGQQSGHLAVNSATNKIYIASQASGGGVFVLNGATNALTKIASTIQTSVIAVNEVSNTIYAGLNGSFGDGTSYIQAIDGTTDTFTRNINTPGGVVGNFGELIAVNSASERIYAILSNGSLAVIDGKRTSPTFNTVLSNVPGEFSGEVVVDEGLNKIVVTSNTSKTSIINGATNTVAATTQGNFSSADVAINPITHRAYIAYVFCTTQAINLNDNSYTNIETTLELGEPIINPNNNFVYLPRNGAVSDIGFLNPNDVIGAVSGTPHGLGRFLYTAQNTLTNRVYVVNSAANAAGTSRSPGYITVIDGATNNAVANIDVGGQPFSNPAVNEATNKIYAMNAGFGAAFPSKITVIDGATNTASTVDTSAFPANTLFYGTIVANPVTNRIYFQIPNGGLMGVIDGATNVATPLSGFTGIGNILVNPNLNRVYLTTSTGIRVLNGANDTEIANIPVSGGAVLNKTTGRIFVFNSQNQTLTAVDGNSNIIVSTVSLPNGSLTMTVNEAANRLYIAVVTDFNDESTSSVLFVNADTLAIENTLSIPLRASRILVNPATNTVYVSTINASQRTGIVVISDILPCTFTISPTSSTIAAAGEFNRQINVLTQNGCAWMAQSNDNWLTVTGGATGSGNGTVTYSAAANSGAQRTGTITVAGQTFTVNQTAASNASSYVVTNTNDSGAGSLRQAILDANATSEDDTITFDISGCPNGICTITLTTGELAIDAASTGGRLTITNAVAANRLLISGNNASRVFFIKQNANATINGVTITGGNGTGTNNTGFLNSGGGISIDGFGTNLVLSNSAVSRNSAQNAGGGIYNVAGALTLINSTISENSANGGGGILTNGGKLTIANSTISNNTATGLNYTAGGIDFTGGNTADLINVTITNNRLTTTDCTTCGGGIWNSNGGYVINLRNTIVAGNSVANTSSSPDIQGPVSASGSFNLIGNNKGTTGIANGTNNNQVGTNTNPLDARLAPLGNYGGATQTHILLPNSPVIDAGSDCVINLTCPSNNPPVALTTDQRGTGFPRKVGSAVDIGAVEFLPPNVVSTVTNTNDSGAGSLRQTILDANATTADDTITFNISGCPNGVCTITLTSGELVIDAASTAGKLTITNSTGANNLLISGNNASRVFFVRSGANATIDGVKITGGNGTGTTNPSFQDYGGGILTESTGSILTLTNSTVSGNATMQQFGGGIYSGGTTTITNSTISGNTGGLGGGVFNELTGMMTMTNSTVSGNTGDGIFNFGILNLTSVTLTNNRVFNSLCTVCGGGIDNRPNNSNSNTLNMLNTVVAGNTVANSNSSPDFRGAVSASSSFNLIGNNQGTTGITNGTNNNQVGTNTSPLDAGLAPLGNYGGTTQTHALLSNSPAIDAGSDCVTNLTCPSNNPPVALTTDQRGTSFPRKVGSAVDIGAFEANSVSTPTGQNISVNPTTNLNLNFGNVTTAGNTVATVIPPDQLQSLPSGFTLFGSNLAYNINTSAVFSGNITVTFAVPNVADASTCGNLRSLHYENGAWTTNTNATPIYNAGTQVCTVAQTVTSLSPFVVVLQTPASFSYEADVSPRPNGDGFVDSDDIQQIRLFSVGGGLPYQSNEFQRVDCSPRSTLGDGFLDSDDVQQARRYSVGTDSSQLAGGPSSGSAPFSLDSAASAIDETFDNSTLFTNRKSKRSPAFHIGGQINNADQTITVPVLIDATGKEAGYTFSLSYDAEMLSNPQVTIGNAGGDAVFNANTARHIGFSVTSFFGETIAPGANQVLVNVTFKVAANAAAGTTAINFTDVLARRKASGVDPNIAVTQPTYTGGIITVGNSNKVRSSFNFTNE